MADNNYHFSVVANEVGAIISVDKKLRSGEIGFAFTRELSKEDVMAINAADWQSLRRRLIGIRDWHHSSKVKTITQVIPISAGVNRLDHKEAEEFKSTLRKLQTAIEQMGPLAKDEPHLNKLHLVSGDFTTNLQAALGNGSLRTLINARRLGETKEELRSILGSRSRWSW